MASCGGLWWPLAACGAGVVAVLEDCILEAPGERSLGVLQLVAACGSLWRGSRGPTRGLHPGGLEFWRLGAWRSGGKDDEAEDADE